MTQTITAFLNFHSKSQQNGFSVALAESERFIPTEEDGLLSALEPFRNSQAFQVKIYDLETTGGRLWGLLNGISQSPAVVIDGKRHVGLVAVNDALEQISQSNAGLQMENKNESRSVYES